MEIGRLVNYEHIHIHRVTFPNSDRYVGITVGIRSESSETAKAIIRKHLNEQFQVKGRQRKQTAEAVEAQELEKIAATIAHWTWERSDPSDESKNAMAKARAEGKSEEEIAALDDSEQATFNGDPKPTLTMGSAIEILTSVNWLYAQIKVAGSDVENFMGKTPKSA